MINFGRLEKAERVGDTYRTVNIFLTDRYVYIPVSECTIVDHESGVKVLMVSNSFVNKLVREL